jgi:hypothetical protein
MSGVMAWGSDPDISRPNISSHWHRGFSPVLQGNGAAGAVSTAWVWTGKPLKRFVIISSPVPPG